MCTTRTERPLTHVTTDESKKSLRFPYDTHAETYNGVINAGNIIIVRRYYYYDEAKNLRRDIRRTSTARARVPIVPSIVSLRFLLRNRFPPTFSQLFYRGRRSRVYIHRSDTAEPHRRDVRISITSVARTITRHNNIAVCLSVCLRFSKEFRATVGFFIPPRGRRREKSAPSSRVTLGRCPVVTRVTLGWRVDPQWVSYAFPPTLFLKKKIGA